MISVMIDPMVLTNPLNGSQGFSRTAHMIRARRRKAQHESAAWVVKGSRELWIIATWQTICVRLVRISPRPFDTDGLAASFKGVRDGVAKALGFSDDSDPRLRWDYAQEKGAPKQNAVRIEFRNEKGE